MFRHFITLDRSCHVTLIIFPGQLFDFKLQKTLMSGKSHATIHRAYCKSVNYLRVLFVVCHIRCPSSFNSQQGYKYPFIAPVIDENDNDLLHRAKSQFQFINTETFPHLNEMSTALAAVIGGCFVPPFHIPRHFTSFLVTLNPSS